MDLLQWLFDARIEFSGGQFLLLREVLGNVFGLLSALGGMRRKVWAWPVGILGNALLLTVFLGTVFGSRTPSTCSARPADGNVHRHQHLRRVRWRQEARGRHGRRAGQASWGARALLLVVPSAA